MAIKFDDDFLRSLGLGDLPPADRADLLKLLYEELELRVGTSLSEGLTNEELDEFEQFVDQVEGAGADWLEANDPDYESTRQFAKFLEAVAATGKRPSETWLLNEYAAARWLDVHRPDYRDVVAENLDRLRKVVQQYRERLLEESRPKPTGPTQETCDGFKP